MHKKGVEKIDTKCTCTCIIKWVLTRSLLQNTCNCNVYYFFIVQLISIVIFYCFNKKQKNKQLNRVKVSVSFTYNISLL